MTKWDKQYMNSRSYPRTMQQAFGPYTDDTLHPKPEPTGYSTAWWAAMGCIAVATLVVIGVTL